MDSWSSYPSVYALGHKAVEELLNSDLILEEKVDGSQFSFGTDEAGELHFRSKGQIIYPEVVPKMFKAAVDHVTSIKDLLHPGWTYRGEVLDKPKHNALAYSRVPVGHVIIFDINTGIQEYLSVPSKQAESSRLGLECVPLLGFWFRFDGRENLLIRIQNLLQRESVLGGVLIEGVVLKPYPYNLYGADKKVLMGKFVSEAYKEVHKESWQKGGQRDILATIIESYRVEARWIKAIAHRAELGELLHALQDIGPLLKEIAEDVKKEEEGEIKEVLFKWAWPHIHRGVTGGFPQWYKERIMREQLGKKND